MTANEREAARREPSSAEIEQSWRRSQLSGVKQDEPSLVVRSDLVERESRFMRAARDILDRSAQTFDGSDLAILVADSSCRVVRTWNGTRRAASAMESIGAVAGSDFSEERLGTNGLGTPFELRKQIAVNGADHFLHPLHSYNCFGMPVLNPLTRRIEGVIDITSLDGRANPLFKPFVGQIVGAIQDELVTQSRMSEQRTFSAFRDATRSSRHGVAALCGDLVLTNSRAAELLREADSLILHEVASGMGFAEHRTLNVPRTDGTALRIGARRVDGTVDGILFDLDVVSSHVGAPHVLLPVPPTRMESVAEKSATTMIHVVGEPGSGRTTAALAEAGERPTERLECTDAALDENAWWARLVHLLRVHTGVLILDDVDLLPPKVAARIAACALDRGDLTVVITSVFDVDSAVAHLTAMCDRRVVTTALRDRAGEMKQVIAQLSQRVPCSPTEAVISKLKLHSWPGNYSELARVLSQASAAAGSTTITVDDLPTAYRHVVPAATAADVRADVVRAETVAALARTNGNKKAAAHDLGISRTTLYTRMRQFQIY